MRTQTELLRNALVLCLPLVALSSCYVTPIGQGLDGTQHRAYSPVPVAPASDNQGTHPVVVSGGPKTATLPVQLYPSNDLAKQTGVLIVQVTILAIGSGRFKFSYQGETLVGEATRVANDGRRGVASAYGQRGMFAHCEYQLSSPRMAGTCAFSNGAQYQLHLGS